MDDRLDPRARGVRRDLWVAGGDGPSQGWWQRFRSWAFVSGWRLVAGCVLAVAGPLVVAAAVPHTIQRVYIPLQLLLLVVVGATGAGRIIPGLLSVGVGVTVGWYFFLPPHDSFTANSPGDVPALVLLALVAFTVAIALSWFSARQEWLRAQQARLAAQYNALGWQLLEAAPDATVIVDRDGIMVYANSRTEGVFGYRSTELVGLPVETLIPSRFARNHRLLCSEYVADAHARQMGEGLELSGHHKRGGEFPVEVSLSPLHNDGGLLIITSIRDVTERKKFEKQLAHQATHDGLTGLPNRVLLTDRLRQALARHQRHGGKLGVLYLDLDHFKWANDSLGHQAGDDLLREVARRLDRVVRHEDTLARFGGDEFVMICDDIEDEHHASEVADRCAQVLSAPIDLAGSKIVITASIGIAICPSGSACEPEEMLRMADTAMYRAKQEGRDRSEVFRGFSTGSVPNPLAEELRLREAIEAGEIVAYYQPEIDLHTSEVVGLEALARWHDPQRGLRLPQDFIALAEETGLIVGLGSQICRSACTGAVSLLGVDSQRTLAVNLSPRQLLSSNIAEVLASILESARMQPASLVVEITENVLLQDVAASSAALRALKDLGVRVAVDDFGTGYSSMLYLKALPIDELKIDRTFVAGLGNDPKDRVIVASVIELAHGLGITATAEGVENDRQLSILRELGCERAQGFYWTRALPPEETAQWMAARPPPTDQPRPS